MVKLPMWLIYGVPAAILIAVAFLWDGHRDLAAGLFLLALALFGVGQRFD